MGNFRIATWREEKASWAVSVRASILSAVDVDVICPAVFPPAAVTSPQEENVILNWEIKQTISRRSCFSLYYVITASVETGESTP